MVCGLLASFWLILGETMTSSGGWIGGLCDEWLTHVLGVCCVVKAVGVALR